MKDQTFKDKLKEKVGAVILARKVLVDELDLSKKFKWTFEIKNQICYANYVIKIEYFRIQEIAFTLDTGEIWAVIAFDVTTPEENGKSTVRIKPEDLEYYEEPKDVKVNFYDFKDKEEVKQEEGYELRAQGDVFNNDPNYLFVRRVGAKDHRSVESFIQDSSLKTIKEVFGVERKGVQLRVVFQCLKDIYDRLERLDRWENE